MPEYLSLFVLLAGLIIGLGAVTVIDLHGFLGRKSEYWTEATTRTHKVTKPLIWLGISLTLIGSILHFYPEYSQGPRIIFAFIFVLILNGCWLTFSVSPYLLQREKKGQAHKLLPSKWQNRITLSFLISLIGWWGLVLLLSQQLTTIS